ncbi:MAG: AbrB/MazE/SpoVT family DNA-binding domain-containing protein [Coriobacteriia bacterium]|nr:AbrB/MazE/SpoVT family DNA-binding domain-containing protein [Coriobacteriia bacterium]
MNLATVSANGQITIPIEIRRSLNLKAGDKVLFLRKQSGEIVLSNSAERIIEKLQEAVADAGFTEDDILAEVMKVRYGDK